MKIWEKFLKQFNNLKFRDSIFDNDYELSIINSLEVLFKIKDEIDEEIKIISFNNNLYLKNINQKIFSINEQIIFEKNNLLEKLRLETNIEEKKQFDIVKFEEKTVFERMKNHNLNMSYANRYFKNITQQNNSEYEQNIDEIMKQKNACISNFNFDIIKFSKEKIGIIENKKDNFEKENEQLSRKIIKINEEMKTKKELFNSENLKSTYVHNQTILEQKNEYIRQNIRINNLINEIKHSSNIEWENLEKAHIVETEDTNYLFEKEKKRFEQSISTIKKKHESKISHEQSNFEKNDEILHQKLTQISHQINLFLKEEKLEKFNFMNNAVSDELKKQLNDKSLKKFLKLKSDIFEYESISNQNLLFLKNKISLLNKQSKLIQNLERIDHDNNIFVLNQRKYLENKTYELEDENENLNLRKKLIRSEIQLNTINNLYNRELAISNLDYENKIQKNELLMKLIEKSTLLEKIPLEKKLDELKILFDYNTQKTNLEYQNIIQKIRLKREKISNESQKKISYKRKLLNENNNYYYFLLQRKIEIEKTNINLHNVNYSIFMLESMKKVNCKKINDEIEAENSYLDELFVLSNQYDDMINNSLDIFFTNNEKIGSLFIVIFNRIIQNNSFFIKKMTDLIYQYGNNEILEEILNLINLFFVGSKDATILLLRKKVFFKDMILKNTIKSYFTILDDIYGKFISKSQLKINEMISMENDISDKIRKLRIEISRDNYLLNQIKNGSENTHASRKQKEQLQLNIKKSQLLFDYYHKFAHTLKKNNSNISMQFKLLKINREEIAIFQCKLENKINSILKSSRLAKYKIYKKLIDIINHQNHNLNIHFSNFALFTNKDDAKGSFLDRIKNLMNNYTAKIINAKNNLIQNDLDEFYKFQNSQKHLIEFKNEMISMLFTYANNVNEEYRNYKISQLDFSIDLKKIENNLLENKIVQINFHDKNELLILKENIEKLKNEFNLDLESYNLKYNYKLKLIDENFATTLDHLNKITTKKMHTLDYDYKKLKMNIGKQLKKIQKELAFLSFNNKAKKLAIIRKFDDLKKESLNNILEKERRIIQKIILNKRRIDFLHFEYNKIIKQNKKKINLASKNLKFEFRSSIKQDEKLLNRKIREIKKIKKS